MSLHDVWQLNLDFLPQKSICIEPVEENLSTDAGLLILRQWDQQQGFTEGFTSQLDDPRREPEHSLLEMVRSRTWRAMKIRTIMMCCGPTRSSSY